MLLSTVLLGGTFVNAQTLEAEFSSLASTNGQLPFWLWANQLGRYDQYSNTIQNFELFGNHSYQFGESDFSIEGQTRLNVLFADDTNIRFTELLGALNWKWLQIKTGAFANEEMYNGLSASNGNLCSPQNARPNPRLRLGLNRYVPVYFDWVSVYTYYEEGLLNDDRYVEDTHLHHKVFYLRLGHPSKLQITMGLEHFVMWGGTHPSYGQLQSWEAYWSYVKGGKGGSDALLTDQINAMGNGYGTYQLEITKKWNAFQAEFYISHPYDDRSGMYLENYKDNLYGVFLSSDKNTPILKSIVMEYYYTKNQSGNTHQVTDENGNISGSGLDNYYNHGIYRSGATYHQMSMVSPLFGPVIISDNISLGFDNTRFSGIHIGANGFLNKDLLWKSMLTYTHNFGKYKGIGDSYDPPRKQLATLLQFSWQLPQKPVVLGASFSADHGSLFDDGQSTTRLGAMLNVKLRVKQ
jgi:hypothetical protein